MLQGNFSDFRKTYLNNQVIEWKQLYIDFSLLKSMLAPFKETYKIYQIAERQSIDQAMQGRNNLFSSHLEIDNDLKSKLETLENEFINIFQSEIEKTATFANHHLVHLKERLFSLENNLKQYDHKIRKGQDQTNEYYQLREYTKLLYKEINMFQRFVTANRQAASRLVVHYERKAFFMDNYIKNGIELIKILETNTIFHEQVELQQMMDDLREIFIEWFYPRKDNEADAILQTEIQDGSFSHKIIFQFGILFGLSLNMLIIILCSRVELQEYQNYRYDLYFPMFRCIGLFLFYFWLLSLNVYIWNKTHINYKLIFRFSHHYSTVYRLLRRAGFFTMLYLTVFLISILKEVEICASESQSGDESVFKSFADFLYFQPAYGPLIIWTVIIIYFCSPFKIFNYQGRKYFWRQLFRAFTAAFQSIDFPVVWLIIQMVGLVIPLRDLYYTGCFYRYYFAWDSDEQIFNKCNSQRNGTPGLIISILPSTLSFIAQIRISHDRNLFKTKFIGTIQQRNCLKITFSVTTTILSFLSANNDTLFNVWMCSAFISGSFAYYCDLKNDWNFLNPNSKYRFLRDQLAYKSPKFYYIMMVIDYPLRMTWILTLSPNHFNIWSPLFLQVISSIEIFRIFLWNFLRVEKDHVVNLGEFRAVLNIPLPYKFVEEIEDDTNSLCSTDSEINNELTAINNLSKKKTIIFASEQIDKANEKQYNDFRKVAKNFQSDRKDKQKIAKKILADIDEYIAYKKKGQIL